jgi:hypothetical protein
MGRHHGFTIRPAADKDDIPWLRHIGGLLNRREGLNERARI